MATRSSLTNPQDTTMTNLRDKDPTVEALSAYIVIVGVCIGIATVIMFLVQS